MGTLFMTYIDGKLCLFQPANSGSGARRHSNIYRRSGADSAAATPFPMFTFVATPPPVHLVITATTLLNVPRL